MPLYTPGLTNPMTTQGDIIVGGSAGTPTRQAIGTNGYVVAADSTATNLVSYQSPVNHRNHLVNSALDYWQASTSINATGSQLLYAADQWFCDNSAVGGSGQTTFAQVTGSLNGSLFGGSVKLTVAGSTGGAVAAQLRSNKDSQCFYGQTASTTIQVKALGNVNQVQIQFISNTSESRVATSTIGSPVSVSVNTSTFPACTINGQALGTAQTAAGIVGVRIKVSGVSTGNVWDLNNGFVFEQAMMNLGPVALPFMRQFDDPATELDSCFYFFEKIGGDVSGTPLGLGYTVSTTSATCLFQWQVKKRAAPTVLFSASNAVIFNNDQNNFTSSALNVNVAGTTAANFSATISGATQNHSGSCGLNLTASVTIDARM